MSPQRGCSSAARIQPKDILAVFGFMALTLVASLAARADDVTADQYEVNGNLTVGSAGVNLSGYQNTDTGYSAGAGLSVGGLFISGYQVDATGHLVNTTGVNDGDNVYFSSLSASGLTLGSGLSVGGNLFLQTSLYLGSWWDGSVSHHGVSVTFSDNHNAYSSQVEFTGAAPQINWSWSPSEGSVLLAPSGNLSLTDSVSGNTVTIVPSNFTFVLSHNSTVLATLPLGNITPVSTVFASNGNLTLGNGNIVLSGAGSPAAITLGNYTLASNSGSSALMMTQNGSAHSVSFDVASQSIEFGSGSSLGGNSSAAWVDLGNGGLAIGNNAVANTTGAVAIGGNASATGAGALALSGGVATGSSALALGSGSVVTGPGSVAMGGGQANGGNALAIGLGSTSQTWGTVVTGHYNLPIGGNATLWSASAPVLVVGNGTSSAASANAMVIYYNGSTALGGNATLTDANHQMQINGASTFNGTTTFGGNVSLGQASGDIPMGSFGGN